MGLSIVEPIGLAFERLDEIVGCSAECVACCERWLRDPAVHELHCVADAFGFCGFDVAVESSVMLLGGAKKPAVHCVLCPRPSVACFFVALHFTADWRQWGAVEVELPPEVGVG